MLSKQAQELLTLEQRADLIERGHLWCWTTFWVGIAAKLQKMLFTKEMLVFIVVSIMFWTNNDGHINADVEWISYLAIAVIFILAESIRTLISKNTKMDVKLGAQVGGKKGE